MRHTLDQIGRCDALFHFGARLPYSVDTIQAGAVTSYLAVNVAATVLLLETAERWQAKGVVFASSLPIIGKPERVPVSEDHPVCPEHPYLLSKYLAERCCEFFRKTGRVAVASLRIASPYGPGMRAGTVLPLFARLAIASQEIAIFGSGARMQNFVHVSDVVRAALSAAETGIPGIFNIAGSHAKSMVDLAQAILAVVPASASRVVFPGCPDPQDDYRWEIDLSRSASVLGFQPKTTLEAGLADYVAWIRSGGGTDYRWWSPCA